MSSSNPFVGMAVYSLMSALELFQKGEERHRLGATILMDLSVEYILKAKLYQLNPAQFIGSQQDSLGFSDAMRDSRIAFLEDEKVYLWKVHEVRNLAQHRGTIPDSLSTREYLKWICIFVKRFSLDNFALNIEYRIPASLKETFSELITEEERAPLDQPFGLKKPLDEKYKTVRDWFSQLEASSRVGPLSKERKKILTSVISKYCEFLKKDPDQIIKHAQNEFYSTGNSKIHDEHIKDFLKNLAKGTPITYWSHIRSFYRENGIRTLTVPRPEYQPKHASDERITIEEIREICKAATIRNRSWILANSYMGLDVGKIRFLKVEDFHTDNWTETKPLYPVTIRKDVSRTFDYTTYIGLDAKNLLNEYFKDKNFKPQDRPWNFTRQTFINDFKRYASRAKVIDSPNGTLGDGTARGFSPITSKSLKKRLETILEKAHTPPDLICYMLGRKPKRSSKTSRPLDSEIEKAYLNVLSELRIFQA